MLLQAKQIALATGATKAMEHNARPLIIARLMTKEVVMQRLLAP
jgi:hypothetical protein